MRKRSAIRVDLARRELITPPPRAAIGAEEPSPRHRRTSAAAAREAVRTQNGRETLRASEARPPARGEAAPTTRRLSRARRP